LADSSVYVEALVGRRAGGEIAIPFQVQLEALFGRILLVVVWLDRARVLVFFVTAFISTYDLCMSESEREKGRGSDVAYEKMIDEDQLKNISKEQPEKGTPKEVPFGLEQVTGGELVPSSKWEKQQDQLREYYHSLVGNDGGFPTDRDVDKYWISYWSPNPGKTEQSMAAIEQDESVIELPVQVVKEGYMIKKGGFVRNWKRRWFVLVSDGKLSYYSTRGAYIDGVRPKGTIDVTGVTEIKELTQTNKGTERAGRTFPQKVQGAQNLPDPQHQPSVGDPRAESRGSVVPQSQSQTQNLVRSNSNRQLRRRHSLNPADAAVAGKLNNRHEFNSSDVASPPTTPHGRKCMYNRVRDFCCDVDEGENHCLLIRFARLVLNHSSSSFSSSITIHNHHHLHHHHHQPAFQTCEGGLSLDLFWWTPQTWVDSVALLVVAVAAQLAAAVAETVV
jgi:hypothetical protein